MRVRSSRRETVVVNHVLNYGSGDTCGAYDDIDFTASQMCCHCGGGFEWNPGVARRTMGPASASYCYSDTWEMGS